MKKYIKTILIIAVVVIVVAALIIPKLNSDDNTVSAQGMAKGGALSVTAHILNEETLNNNVTSSGTVLANEEIELKSEVSGKITKIAFREGTPVNKGALLVKINDAELQARLRGAQYRLKLLEDQEFRQKRLLEKEAISQQDYDVSLNELNVVKADIDLIKAQIDKTEIKAPFNGIIGLKYVSEGSFVTTSSVIASLQNINPIKIDFSIPEKYFGTVKVGDPIKFKVEGVEEIYDAKVYAIEPRIDPVTRTLQMRALYNNPSGEILPGAFANITLVLKEIEDALLVPTNAIVPELKGQKVYVFQNGDAVSVSVNTGIRTEKQIQITDGLSAGDTIITSGILQIRPGVKIEISEFN